MVIRLNDETTVFMTTLGTILDQCDMAHLKEWPAQNDREIAFSPWLFRNLNL